MRWFPVVFQTDMGEQHVQDRNAGVCSRLRFMDTLIQTATTSSSRCVEEDNIYDIRRVGNANFPNQQHAAQTARYLSTNFLSTVQTKSQEIALHRRNQDQVENYHAVNTTVNVLVRK